MSDKLTRPLLLAGCGKMGSAMLSGWLESGITGGGVVVVEAEVRDGLGLEGHRASRGSPGFEGH